MSSISRRRMMIAGIGGFSLATAGFMAPGAFAANSIDGDVKVSNTETVQIAMNAAGEIDTQRIYEQLVLTGKGKVDISNPVSTKGLRNLDGFGGYNVRDGKVRVKTGVDGTKKYRSVSDFTKKLPLDIKITYTLDGKKIEPGDVVGKSGELEVRYVVTNTTGASEDVKFADGKGEETSSTEDVVIPMVGTLSTVLPSTFTKVVPDGANAAGDGRGGTQLSFTMTLIPPIGSAKAEFGYKAKVKDAVIPKADISALPVNPLENTSFKGGAESYKGGAETGQDLTAGATTIDSNLLTLRDGASDLVSGILQLQAGANQLSAGLNNDAAPGAKKLADGSNELNAGAKKLKGGTSDLTGGAGDLNDGASKISAGLSKIRKGVNANGSSPGLIAGTEALVGGLDALEANLAALKAGVANGTPASGGKGLDNAIRPGVAGLIAALDGTGGDPSAAAALGQIKAVIDGARAYVGATAPNATLDAQLGAASGGVTTLSDKLTDQALPGLLGIQSGLKAVSDTIAASIGQASDGPKQSLRGGVAALTDGATGLKNSAPALVGGVNELSEGAKKLRSGTEDLVSGANQLNAGAGQLSDGTGQLSAGAGTLADGLGTAAAGSGKLAAGLDEAAEGAPKLPEGADRLSKEGTSEIVKKGDATAKDFGLRYALLEAGAARAATAQPYGSPDGAVALTAYKFEIAGADGAESANLKRGIAAIVLLVGAGLFATVRRRGLI